jgi:hypothetical protein
MWGEMNDVGSLLPRLAVLVALPPTGNPTLSIESWESTSYAAVQTYLPNNDPPADSAAIFRVGILGGVRVVPLTIHPISYTNESSTCRVLQHAVIRIDIDNSAGDNPVTMPRTNFSRSWQQMFRALVVNWQDIPNYHSSQSSHLLIIVPDAGVDSAYVNLIRPFIRWKEQRGTKVTLVRKSSIGSNPGASLIRARIISEVEVSSPRIDHVLLVGDETKIGVSMQFTADPYCRFTDFSYPGSYTNDQYYSTIEGTDVFPDVFVGRWVINSRDELQTVIARSLNHERDPMASDSARFLRAAVAADNELESQRGTKRKVASMLVDHGFLQVDSLWGHGPQTNFSMWVDSINRGVNFINYRGQGWNYGWWGIGFFNPDIPNIQNVGKLPIVTGIGCGVGMFGDAEAGFAETWMISGTVSEPAGSVAFIGPCWNTHTMFNNCLDSCLYKAWLDYDVLEVGAGLAAGKMMVWDLLAEFLPDSQVREVTSTMFRQYMLQGDPTLQVYTKTPYVLQVTAPDRLPDNPTDFSFTISNLAGMPAESLNVTLWYGDGIYGTYWMNRGTAAITVPVDRQGAPNVTLTITGDNIDAYQKVIPFGADAVEPVADPLIPENLSLAQNYPNPFNPETTIEFALPHSGPVTLDVYNILGARVAQLVNSTISAGKFRVSWNGRLDNGQTAGSGIYYYRLTSNDGTLTRKMMLLK